MAEREPTTGRLAQEYDMALKRHATAKTALGCAAVALEVAATNLGERIDPGDQVVGETICVWVGFYEGDERLIEATKHESGQFVIRRRPRVPAEEGVKNGETKTG